MLGSENDEIKLLNILIFFITSYDFTGRPLSCLKEENKIGKLVNSI